MALINIPKRIQRTVWLNVYAYGAPVCHESREAAESVSLQDRIACIPITIDCEEGEGL